MTAENQNLVESCDTEPLLATGQIAAGTILNDSFRIDSLIGQGGMGSVYRGMQLALDRVVAIKVMNLMDVRKEDLQRFNREGKALAGLQHPNIISALHSGLWNQRLFLVTEFVDGLTLADTLKNEQRLEPKTALPIFLQIASALSHAHENGLVHRDVKPSNVMIFGQENSVKVLDFGIVKTMLYLSGDQRLTRSGQDFGTPLYMSPEQCLGETIDERSDVYSLGCLMYETLTGTPPFVGANRTAILYQQVNSQPEPLQTAIPQLNKLVLRCLAKDPNDRFSTMSRLVSALDAVGQSLHVHNGPESFLKGSSPRHSKYVQEVPADTTGGDSDVSVNRPPSRRNWYRPSKKTLLGFSSILLLAITPAFFLAPKISLDSLVAAFAQLIDASGHSKDLDFLRSCGDRSKGAGLPHTAIVLYRKAEAASASLKEDHSIENFKTAIKRSQLEYSISNQKTARVFSDVDDLSNKIREEAMDAADKVKFEEAAVTLFDNRQDASSQTKLVVHLQLLSHWYESTQQFDPALSTQRRILDIIDKQYGIRESTFFEHQRYQELLLKAKYYDEAIKACLNNLNFFESHHNYLVMPDRTTDLALRFQLASAYSATRNDDQALHQLLLLTKDLDPRIKRERRILDRSHDVGCQIADRISNQYTKTFGSLNTAQQDACVWKVHQSLLLLATPSDNSSISADRIHVRCLAMVSLGNVLSQWHQEGSALGVFEDAVRLGSPFKKQDTKINALVLEAEERAGAMCLALNKKTDGLRHYRRALVLLDKFPQSDVRNAHLYSIGNGLYAFGIYREAESVFADLCKHGTQHNQPANQLCLGRTQIKLRKYNEARSTLDRALAKSSMVSLENSWLDDIIAERINAEEYMNPNPEETIAFGLRTLKTLKPRQNEGLNTAIYSVLGKAYLKSHRYSEALPYLERTVKWLEVKEGKNSPSTVKLRTLRDKAKEGMEKDLQTSQ